MSSREAQPSILHKRRNLRDTICQVSLVVVLKFLHVHHVRDLIDHPLDGRRILVNNTLLMSLDSECPQCPLMSLLTAYTTPNLSDLDQFRFLLSHAVLPGFLLALRAPRPPVLQ